MRQLETAPEPYATGAKIDPATTSARSRPLTPAPAAESSSPDQKAARGDPPARPPQALRAALIQSLALSRAHTSPPSLDESPQLRRVPPALAPPPVRAPFQVPFPDGLARRAPGLTTVIQARGGTLWECGMASRDDAGTTYQNQCLYLSLAAAMTQGSADIPELAARTRITIEEAVRNARPDWTSRDFLGEAVGAFADFLVYGLQATPTLRGRAVAIYDGRVATCEIIRPLPLDLGSPVLALWFSGAHYRWLRWRDPGPTLPDLLDLHAVSLAGQPRVHTLVTQALN